MATMTPLDVEAIFQNAGQDAGPSQDAVAIRSQQLQPVLETAQQLWYSGSPGIDSIAQKLGDGSRDVSWRAPLGQSGILSFFAVVLSTLQDPTARPSLLIHSLRLIGNSCADTNENRDRLVQSGSLQHIVNIIFSAIAARDPTTIPYVVPVLYNICVDYDPAQDATVNAGVAPALLSLTTGPLAAECGGLIGLICQILSFRTEGDPGTLLVRARDLLNFMRFPLDAVGGQQPEKLEASADIFSTALAYFSNPSFHQELATDPECIRMLLEGFQAPWLSRDDAFDPDGLDPDLLGKVKSIQTAYLNLLADVSASDLFAATLASSAAGAGPSHNELLLLQFLASPRAPGLQTAACLVLGNLARNDATAARYVQGPTHRAHEAGVAILAAPSSAGNSVLLHAALGLLRNLAVPASNKPLLGPGLLAGPDAPLPRLWDADPIPQVQFAAVSLARSLCAGCPSNVRILLCPLSDDPAASPASARTKLSVLLALGSRSDAEPTRTECARLVLAVCRALHSTPVLVLSSWPTAEETYHIKARASKRTDRVSKAVGPPPLPAQAPAVGSLGVEGQGGKRLGEEDDDETRPSEVRRAFYANHPEVPKVLASLAGQTKWPALRSEAWFVFALMARSPEGARMVMEVLMEAEPAIAFQEALTGEGDASMATLVGDLDASAGAIPTPAGDAGGSFTAAKDGQCPSQEDQLRALGLAGDGGQLEPQQMDPKNKEKMARVDRENGVVLITELLRNCPDIAPMQRATFQALLEKAGKVVHAQSQSLSS